MNDIQYFGLFLDKIERMMVLGALLENDSLRPILAQAKQTYFDHCTLLHKSQFEKHSELYKYLSDRIGEKMNIRLTALGCSAKAMAFKVELPDSDMCANDIPHVTVITLTDGKPVDSNYITDWEELDVPITVCTKLDVR